MILVLKQGVVILVVKPTLYLLKQRLQITLSMLYFYMGHIS